MSRSRYNQNQRQKTLLEQLEDDLPPSREKAILDLYNHAGPAGKAAIIVGGIALGGLFLKAMFGQKK